MVTVARDTKLQNSFKEEYGQFIEEFIFLNSFVCSDEKSSLEANRKDILHMLDINIVRLRGIYNLVNNLDMLDTQEDEDQDEVQDIEIPFVFNCVECGTQLKQGDDFNYCKRCLNDYITEQDKVFTN